MCDPACYRRIVPIGAAANILIVDEGYGLGAVLLLERGEASDVEKALEYTRPTRASLKG